MNTIRTVFAISLICLVLISCTNQPKSRYKLKQDTAPQFEYGEINLQDAIPRYEPYAPLNMRPYEVFGQYYTPILTGKGFAESGQASWYGQKFHGHRTSNGEVYDMFRMTAAHKTLPLPSFVKVTNLDNQKTAVVRVNDRGPFHPGRIIDLSYAAAKKLDVISTGVANVKIEVIHIDNDGIMTVGTGDPVQPDVPAALADESQFARTNDDNYEPKNHSKELDVYNADTPTIEMRTPFSDAEDKVFVQVAAFSNKEAMLELSDGLGRLYQVPTEAPLIDDIYRLRLGPLKNEQKAEKLIEELKELGFNSAFRLIVPAE
ncbi:septal ring lytic transglycosylase RlpA family protein [Glaciecola sp. MH2013]|uniref:septal ring lytic transglycosylase RlpA family protein n=1 Tax=Glaciecola sp. MH2013 TaxID=2785524 RepID=UPI00189C5EDA|nr:septal ring lytic transglycosylase RlpA family protein [Glaciecola sp. MH2013]MBF7072623.1 septal ring lytic transglycosylase RlpA family protein [Glaciecola sp. MH2013]